MKNEKLIEEIEKQISQQQNLKVWDVLMIIIGICTLWIFLLGLIFIILGGVGLSKRNSNINDLKLKLAEVKK